MYPGNFRLQGRSTALFSPVHKQSGRIPWKPFQRSWYPFPGAFRPHMDVAVARIPNEPVSPFFQFLIQLIQQNVAEQGGKRAAPRRSLRCVTKPPSIIPACRCRRIRSRMRLSSIRRASRDIRMSWSTRSKNFSKSISTTQRDSSSPIPAAYASTPSG